MDNLSLDIKFSLLIYTCKGICKYLCLLNAYRDDLIRDISILSMYRGKISPEIFESGHCALRKSHPRYLSFPGFIAMTLDVERFCRKIPHSKRPDIRDEKLCSLDDLSDKSLT